MIKNCRFPGQKIAVGKLEYKKIIEERLVSISCWFSYTYCTTLIAIFAVTSSRNTVPVYYSRDEVNVGGSKFHGRLPGEKSQLAREDRLPMSLGLLNVMRRYGCKVKPEMVS